MKTSKHLRKTILLVGLFMLNMTLGHLAVEFLGSASAAPASSNGNHPYDQSDLHYRMSGPKKADSTGHDSLVCKGHFTVMK